MLSKRCRARAETAVLLPATQLRLILSRVEGEEGEGRSSKKAAFTCDSTLRHVQLVHRHAFTVWPRSHGRAIHAIQIEELVPDCANDTS